MLKKLSLILAITGGALTTLAHIAFLEDRVSLEATGILVAPLFIIAGALALACAGKPSFGKHTQDKKPERSAAPQGSPALKTLSIIIGIICAVLAMIPWVMYAGEYIYMTYLIEIAEPYDPSYLFIPALLISAAGLLGSLLLRKKPAVGAALMLVSGGVNFCFAYIWWHIASSLLLAAAGVLVLTSAVKLPRNTSEAPDSAG